METVALEIAYRIGRIAKPLMMSTFYTLIVGVLLFVPFRKKRYWRIVIAAWFIFFAWWVLRVTAGLVYIHTSSRAQAIFVSTVFALVVATTPVVLFSLFRRNVLRFLYAFIVIVLVGPASPILDFVFPPVGQVLSSANMIASDKLKSSDMLNQDPVSYIDKLRAQFEKETAAAGVSFNNQDQYREDWKGWLAYEYMNLQTQFEHNRSRNLQIDPKFRTKILEVLGELERICLQTGNTQSLTWIQRDKKEIHQYTEFTEKETNIRRQEP